MLKQKPDATLFVDCKSLIAVAHEQDPPESVIMIQKRKTKSAVIFYLILKLSVIC